MKKKKKINLNPIMVKLNQYWKKVEPILEKIVLFKEVFILIVLICDGLHTLFTVIPWDIFT